MLQYFTGKHLRSSLFIIKLQSFKSAILLKRDPNTGVFSLGNFCATPTLKNLWVRLFLNWLYEVIIGNFVSGQSFSKPSLNQMQVAFNSEL